MDARKGIVEYVASDETLDFQGEVVRASGWRFTHFPKNSPLVDSHNYTTIEKVLGKVIDVAVKNRRLIEVAQWAINVPENRLAQFGWKMTEAGFLRAVSVGFKPVKWLTATSKGWAAELSDLKLNDQADKVRRIYIEQEQVELSAVVLGANPNAVAQAYKAGVVTDADVEFISESHTHTRAHPPQRTPLADSFMMIFDRLVADCVTRAPAPRARPTAGRRLELFVREFERALKRT